MIGWLCPSFSVSIASDRQGVGEERCRLPAPSLRIVECCQIVEASGDMGMVGTQLAIAQIKQAHGGVDQ